MSTIDGPQNSILDAQKCCLDRRQRFGARCHRQISEVDIDRSVADVTAGKTVKDEKVGPRKRIIVRGGAGAACKIVRDLSAVFTCAHAARS